jgi:hypothetical protein
MRNLTEDGSQCLAWKWNWFRQSLVEASADFSGLATRSDAPVDTALWQSLELRCQQVAHQLAQTMRAADLPQVRIHKPLQWFFRRHFESANAGAMIDQAGALRVMLWRILQRMEEAAGSAEPSGDLSQGWRASVLDCRSLVNDLTSWMDRQSTDLVAQCLSRYREIDRLVAHELRPFDDALWSLPGLGRSRDVAVGTMATQ